MKKLLFVFYILVISINGYSQYNKFIDNNKVWVEFYNYQNLEDIRPGESTIFFVYFDGDTILNNTKYHKLFKQRFYIDTWYTNDTSNLIDSTLQSPVLYAILREDSINKKVYNKYEEIIYDFSLNVGDTLEAFGYNIVDSIVPISLNNSDLRNKFYFTNINESITNYYIEGIGGGNGLIEPFYYLGLSGYQSSGGIICYKENLIELYGTCDYPEFISSITNINLINSIKIYPNPVQSFVEIDLGKLYNQVSIKLYDSMGKLLLDRNYKSIQSCSIDMAGIPEGIFLMSFVLDQKNICSLPVIKK